MYLSDYLFFLSRLDFFISNAIEYFGNPHRASAMLFSASALAIALLNMYSVWEKEDKLSKKIFKTCVYVFILIIAVGSTWYQSSRGIKSDIENVKLDSLNKAQDSLFQRKLQINFDSLNRAYKKLAIAERTSTELQAAWRREEIAEGSFPIISFQRQRTKFVDPSNDSAITVDLLHFYIENNGEHVLKNVVVEFEDDFGARFREMAYENEYRRLKYYRVIGEGINIGAFQRIAVGNLYPNMEPRKFFTAALMLDTRKDVIPGSTLLDNEHGVYYNRMYVNWHSDAITYGFELGPNYGKVVIPEKKDIAKIYMLAIYGKYEDQYEIYTNHLDYLSDRFIQDIRSWKGIWGHKSAKENSPR